MERQPADPEYSARVAERVGLMQKRAVQVNERVERTQRALDKASATTEGELLSAAHEMIVLEDECRTAVRRVTQLVDGFRTIVKQGDLRRLQQKIDRWAPEKNVSRKMLLRMKSS